MYQFFIAATISHDVFASYGAQVVRSEDHIAFDQPGTDLSLALKAQNEHLSCKPWLKMATFFLRFRSWMFFHSKTNQNKKEMGPERLRWNLFWGFFKRTFFEALACLKPGQDQHFQASVHFPLISSIDKSQQFWNKFWETPRIEPGTTGWEARILPLCYAW